MMLNHRCARRVSHFATVAIAFALSLGPSTSIGGAEPSAHVVKVKLTSAGFEPAQIRLAPNAPAVLEITRETDATCAREIVVPALNINVPLPLRKTVRVDLGRVKAGRHAFGCAMSLMVGGDLIVGEDAKTPTSPRASPAVRPVGTPDVR